MDELTLKRKQKAEFAKDEEMAERILKEALRRIEGISSSNPSASLKSTAKRLAHILKDLVD